jgi:pyrroline-5-carboxylate reductase
MSSRIGFIGAGRMAEALIKGMVRTGVSARSDILISDTIGERLDYLENEYGVIPARDNREVARSASILFLTVKPQNIESVLSEVGSDIHPDTLVVSIAAGITTQFIEQFLAVDTRVIRLMPNTPLLVGEGITALCLGKNASESEVEEVKMLTGGMSKIIWIEERLMDAVTGFSGSGPAYVFLLIEAFADGGVMAGFSRESAMLLAAQTFLGAAKMVLESDEHPGRLKDMVTSPGGTAITGIYALEKAGVRAALMSAVQEATRRSRELGMDHRQIHEGNPLV